MVDAAFSNLAVAGEPGQYRKAGSVRRGPALGAQVVRLQFPSGSRAGNPSLAAVLAIRIKELVEAAIRSINHNYVSVSR